MKAGAISAGVFGIRGVSSRAAVREEIPSKEETLKPIVGWNPGKFASEQLRSLVERVFSPGLASSVRHVVFSAVDRETDIRPICRQVGEILAAETSADVAVVVEPSQTASGTEVERFSCVQGAETRPRREIGEQGRGNLWTVPLCANSDGLNTFSLHKHLEEIRREFQYSIIAGAACGESNQAIAMSQGADGTILVLSARYTRRLAALRVRDALDGARVRLLGTVLTDREFPIPEKIYRRL